MGAVTAVMTAAVTAGTRRHLPPALDGAKPRACG